jgi:hypothetical protein
MNTPYPQFGHDGWITVKTDQLMFPQCCADCCGPAYSHLTLRGGSLDAATIVTFAFGVVVANEIRIQVPICEVCPVEGRQKGGVIGSIVLAGILGGFSIYLTTINRLVGLMMLPVFAGAGGVFGFLIGAKIGYKEPVQIKGYSPKERTIMVRFSRPEYRDLFLKNFERVNQSDLPPFAEEVPPFAEEVPPEASDEAITNQPPKPDQNIGTGDDPSAGSRK